MNGNIPGTMKAVCLDESDNSLVVRDIPVPVPGKGEVLVRISAAPVNPSDLARMKHLTSSEKKQFVAGIEGSGTVISHGKGILPSLWMDRRVACSSTRISSGTWAEYMVTSAMACVPLPKGISVDQGAMMLVNPMTAVAFMKIAKSGNHKAVINTASLSTLGRMIDFLAKKHNITLIQVVRNEKQKSLLIEGGARHVLNSSENRFEVDLHSLAKKYHAAIAFDAIGGEMTRRLLLSMPYGGTVMVYGNLSGEQPLVDHRALVTDNKKVEGFYLVNWLRENGLLTTLGSIIKAGNMLKRHISIPVQEKFRLEDAQIAVDTYLANMSGGKVLIVP